MSSDINVQTFSGKVNITSNLLVGSSHLFVDTINNRVGLVTTTPDAGIHVNSNAYVHTNFRVGSGIVMNDTTGRITAGSFEGDASLLTDVPGDSGSWVNGTSSNVHLATTGDKVGIGTVSPSSIFNTYGGELWDGTDHTSKVCATLQVGRGSGAGASTQDAGTGAILEFRHHSDYRFVTVESVSEGNYSSEIGIRFKTMDATSGPEERMRIDAHGNVGIGVTTVDSGIKLQVNGVVKATGFTGIQTSDVPTLNQNTTGSAGSATTAGTCTGNSATATTAGTCSGNSATATTAGYATSAGDADTVDGQHAHEMSWGHDTAHSTYTDFNTFINTDKFGAHYITGTTNGPGQSGPTQYYHQRMSLGSQYNDYSLQLAIGRGRTDNYLWYRNEESSSASSWYKMRAGYADSAGTITSQANSATITATSANTANQICQRNGSGDIFCRLFRSDYQNQSDCGAGIAFRNSTTDNYIRFCTTMSAVRSRIGCAATAGSTGQSFYTSTIYIGGSTSKGLRSVSGNYGTVQTTGGGSGGWEGYSIDGRYVFMSSDNNSCGIYNDIDNEWMIYCYRNDYVKLYYNGGERFITTSYGNSIQGGGLRIHVFESTSNYTNSASDWWTNGGSIQADPPNLNFSLYCAGAIRAPQYVAFSDVRIKKDITEIDDTSALESLRKLNPTTYNYIDKTKTTNGKVIGFIAQEVAEVLPNAVTKAHGVLPNIQCEASVEILSDTEIKLVLVEPLPNNHTVRPESKLIIKIPKHENIEFEVVSLENDTTIIVKDKDGYDKIKTETRVWVFGEEINDFHHLDKNAIFTIATAALQEVDRQLQAEKTKTYELQQKVEILEMSHGALIQRIEALENL